jgi:hypothetical protein
VVVEVIPSVVGIGIPRVRPDHASHGSLQVGGDMPLNPAATGVFLPQQQGLAGVLVIIEARLQAIEQAVFGGAYSQQQQTLGNVANLNFSQQASGPGFPQQGGSTNANRS